MRPEARGAIVLSWTKSEGTNWRKDTLKKFRQLRRECFWEQEARFRADISKGESARARHVIVGTLPCVLITSLNQGAHVAKNAESDMWRLMGSKAKKSKKSGCERISGFIKRVYARVSCVSRFSSEKIHSAERKEMWHQITPSNAPRARWYHSKTRERKGPSRGVVHKCEPHERNPCAPRFEETTHDETVHQEKRARRTWRRVSLKLKKILIKLRFLALLLKPGQRWRPLQHHRRNENSWLILEHQCTCWARGFKVRRIGDSAEIQKPHNGGNDHWRSANKRGSTRTRSQTWCLRDGANIRWHACSSITGKLC